MGKKFLVWILFLFVSGCGLIKPSYHDLKSWHVNLILENDSLDFSQEEWLAGSPIERGKMMAGLLRSHSFNEMNNNEVFELLGESQCYLYYDDEPCYLIQYGDESFYLGFGINHSDSPGKIVQIVFFKP